MWQGRVFPLTRMTVSTVAPGGLLFSRFCWLPSTRHGAYFVGTIFNAPWVAAVFWFVDAFFLHVISLAVGAVCAIGLAHIVRYPTQRRSYYTALVNSRDRPTANSEPLGVVRGCLDPGVWLAYLASKDLPGIVRDVQQERDRTESAWS
jgi:hypothetical protein